MEERFDFELASESLQFFDCGVIPKIDTAIPATVSDIRFTSDMSGISPLTLDSLKSAGGLFAAASPFR
jgi:hypothetical protein